MKTHIALLILLACGCAASGAADTGDDGGLGNDASSIDSSVKFSPDASDAGSAQQQVGGPLFAIAAGDDYGNDVLYSYDPSTQVLKTIASLSGDCTTGAWGLAIDSASNAYFQGLGPTDAGSKGTTKAYALCRLDLATAATTLVGLFPNTIGTNLTALSFVPKGTLDPSSDALVGYYFENDGVNNRTQYVRIDKSTAALTVLGTLQSDDTKNPIPVSAMTSVMGGGTFVSVWNVTMIGGKQCGTALGDCLLQVDPKTGALVQNYGPVLAHDAYHVFGLAYWGGIVYGFGDRVAFETTVYAVAWNGNVPVTTGTKLPKYPTASSFVGAASSLAAPATDADGGGPPIN